MIFAKYLVIWAVLFISVFAVPSTSAQESIILTIPKLELDALVVSIYLRAFDDGSVTWDTTNLHHNVGYFDGTAWFGQQGNTILGGHSELTTGEDSVFAKLHKLRRGDILNIKINGEILSYVVSSVSKVAAHDLSPLYPTTNEQLTLITCDTSSYNRSKRTYSRRIVVTAQRAG